MGFEASFEDLERRAAELGEAGDREGLGELLRQTILVSPDARSLLRVLLAEPFDWVSWTADGELPRENIEALFDRVLAFTAPKERAAGLGLLGALATLEPARTLGVDGEIRRAKAGTLGVLDSRRGALRDLAAAKQGPVRSGAAMLLERAPVAGEHEVALLLELAGRERSAGIQAAQLLAASIMDRSGTPDRTDEKSQTILCEYERCYGC